MRTFHPMPEPGRPCLGIATRTGSSSAGRGHRGVKSDEVRSFGQAVAMQSPVVAERMAATSFGALLCPADHLAPGLAFVVGEVVGRVVSRPAEDGLSQRLL